jgi:hypothetical protein
MLVVILSVPILASLAKNSNPALDLNNSYPVSPAKKSLSAQSNKLAVKKPISANACSPDHSQHKS